MKIYDDKYIQEVLSKLKTSKFRNSFHLKKTDITYIDEKGFETIEKHAKDFISNRLAPAMPKNDGRQTPFRGHPVFVAQHATATCCRGCLEKWHGIKKGTMLDEDQLNFVVRLIMEFISQEYFSQKSQN